MPFTQNKNISGSAFFSEISESLQSPLTFFIWKTIQKYLVLLPTHPFILRSHVSSGFFCNFVHEVPSLVFVVAHILLFQVLTPVPARRRAFHPSVFFVFFYHVLCC